jgi:hypothetical protein
MTTSQALDRKSQADIAGVRAWISRHLDPLDAAASTTTPFRSDYDLKASPPPRQGSVTPAAVLIALAERSGGLSVILTRRSDTLRRHSGQIALPGGRCDPGEMPWQTPVVGFLAADFTTAANPAEVADIFETPFGFLMDPANHEQREARESGGNIRHFYAMTWEDRLIWGATAGILRALYDRLYGALVA